MSATRSVDITVEANLVIGFIMSTCGRSWSAAHLPLAERALAADMEHRAFRAEGGGDAGHRVGAAGTRRRHHAAELAGLARIAVGGVRRRLLVAHVDDADALIEAAVVDVDDMAAAKREDGVHALGLQRLGDEMPARDDARVTALLPSAYPPPWCAPRPPASLRIVAFVFGCGVSTCLLLISLPHRAGRSRSANAPHRRRVARRLSRLRLHPNLRRLPSLGAWLEPSRNSPCFSHMPGKAERVLAHQAFGEVGLAAFQRRDDVHVIDDRASAPGCPGAWSRRGPPAYG